MPLRSCVRSYQSIRIVYGRLSTPRSALCYTNRLQYQTNISRDFSHSLRSCFSTNAPTIDPGLIESYKESFKTELYSQHRFEDLTTAIGRTVKLCGFLGKRQDISKNLSFVKISESAQSQGVQVTSRAQDGEETHNALRNVRPYSAVFILAEVGIKRAPKNSKRNASDSNQPTDPNKLDLSNLELILKSIETLAELPRDIVVSDDVQFPPEQRHLQIRFQKDVMQRLKFRDTVVRVVRSALSDFQEVETPILFKSTPEGAREFLVPTRRPGYAYALPQSPQQYKQILMASGIPRYFQIAKCFRDEDLRADRQPEFTQIDLEMAFSDGEAVMQRMQTFIQDLYAGVKENSELQLDLACPLGQFPRMTYEQAMSMHGVDKPDLRTKFLIRQVDQIMNGNTISMITSLSNPIVEGFKIKLDTNAEGVRAFISEFLESAEADEFSTNPVGAPGVFIFNPKKPLQGLGALGHEGADAVQELFASGGLLESTDPEPQSQSMASSGPLKYITPSRQEEPFEEGDLLIIQARPREPFSGGSTSLGRLRIALHKAAVAQGLIQPDPSHQFLWVTDFPLFTPQNASDPGQGGESGFSATHHPFTAPKTAADVDLLFTNPMAVKADHYDLVVNGVELGGGSRRIHNSEVQQFVMRHVLKMSEERMNDFAHLFEALRAGCPPHAGIALGLDRLVAMLLGRESVRDVIAFPKSGKGIDLMVGSPTLMTASQQRTYHLKVLE